MRHASSITTSVLVDSDALVWTIRGSAESEVADQLSTSLAALHADAVSSAMLRVVIDLQELEFATSSCLKIIASWLLEANEAQNYKILLRANARHPWQKRSLQAIASCAPDTVAIETIV